MVILALFSIFALFNTFFILALFAHFPRHGAFACETNDFRYILVKFCDFSEFHQKSVKFTYFSEITNIL